MLTIFLLLLSDFNWFYLNTIGSNQEHQSTALNTLHLTTFLIFIASNHLNIPNPAHQRRLVASLLRAASLVGKKTALGWRPLGQGR